MSKIIEPMEPIEPAEPALSPEEQDEQAIREQPDAVEIIARSAHDPIQNIIYMAVESKALNKKVVSRFDYVEEMENNKVVGRSMRGSRKESVLYDAEIQEIAPSVIDRRPIKRG